MEKEVQNQVGSKNLNLIVLELIKKGLNPAKICNKLNISKTRIQYYLSKLRNLGLIKKVGYGVWEVQEVQKTSTKEVQKTSKVAKKGGVLKADSVRGHAFVFRLQLPKSFSGWSNREKVFRNNNIKFNSLIIGGVKRGQRLVFKGRKVHLFKRSIVIYEKASFLSDTAKSSKDGAMSDFLKFIKSFEKFIGANFNNKYRFKVCRQHYSLVKNALAKQYNEKGEKLQVFGDDGLWLLIDNSYNLHECETVHSRTGVSDNKKVQDFFNGLKKFNNYSPEFVVSTMQGIQENQLIFAKNIESHIKAIQDLGDGVKRLTELIEKLEDKK